MVNHVVSVFSSTHSEIKSSRTSVLLGSSGGEGGEARHEEVEAGEGNHIDRQLPEVGVQLTGEPTKFIYWFFN